MKVNFLNQKLWKEYCGILSIISTIASLIFLFIDIPSEYKKYCFIALFIVIIFIFFVKLHNANNIKEISLKINSSTIEIKKGNIFSEEGFKIIAFNEFYDTQVDDILISKNTINGKYIKKYCHDISELDKIIESDTHACQHIIEICDRKIGKTKKYKLGTIIKNNDFFLLAFTHFDSENRAFLEMKDYITCLMNMWNECDILYGGTTIILPLLGSGITRFHRYENITDQELIEIIIWTFQVSHVRFKYSSKLKIILTEDSLERINLYNIKNRFE